MSHLLAAAVHSELQWIWLILQEKCRNSDFSWNFRFYLSFAAISTTAVKLSTSGDEPASSWSVSNSISMALLNFAWNRFLLFTINSRPFEFSGRNSQRSKFQNSLLRKKLKFSCSTERLNDSNSILKSTKQAIVKQKNELDLGDDRGKKRIFPKP